VDILVVWRRGEEKGEEEEHSIPLQRDLQLQIW
jgi:hypothetical protein